MLAVGIHEHQHLAAAGRNAQALERVSRAYADADQDRYVNYLLNLAPGGSFSNTSSAAHSARPSR